MSLNEQFIGKDVTLGKGVKIWHFVFIGERTKIGDRTTIGSLSHVDRDVEIGKKCMIGGMVYIPPLTVIGDNVFVGPGVVITNDRFPPRGRLAGVRIKNGAVLCAGSMLRAGVVVGENSVVGMGAVVANDVPDNAVVFGIPAKLKMTRSEYDQRRELWRKGVFTNSDPLMKTIMVGETPE
jgi:acetyltransferase-like isoleucine patch superfamily enzyme